MAVPPRTRVRFQLLSLLVLYPVDRIFGYGVFTNKVSTWPDTAERPANRNGGTHVIERRRRQQQHDDNVCVFLRGDLVRLDAYGGHDPGFGLIVDTDNSGGATVLFPDFDLKRLSFGDVMRSHVAFVCHHAGLRHFNFRPLIEFDQRVKQFAAGW